MKAHRRKGTIVDEKVKAFLHRVSEDEKLREKVEGIGDVGAEEAAQAISAIARAEGFDLSPEDLLSLGASGDGELDDAELAQVSGGGTACACVAFGFGDMTDNDGKQYGIGCPVFGKCSGYVEDGTGRPYYCLCIAGGGGALG